MLVFFGFGTPVGGTTSTITPAPPAGVPTGAMMLMQVSSNLALIPTVEPGWDLVDSETGGTCNILIYSRIRAAGDAATYTVTRNGSSMNYCAGIMAWTSDAGRPLYIDAHANQSNTSSTTRTFPSVTTTKTSTGLSCFANLGSNGSSIPVSLMDEQWDVLVALGNRIYLMTTVLNGAGPTGILSASGVIPSTSRCVTVAVAESSFDDTRWRVLIGPYHSQYPWYSHQASIVEDLAYATTLTGAMTVGSTANMTLASGASFPSAGGLWVGPVNSGEGWEYVVYTGKSTNTLTGVARESAAVRDHNGTHGVGAAVKVWYELTSNDGALSFTETFDDTYSVLTWSCTISGFLFPQHVCRNNHIAIVQTNDDQAGWTNYLVGFVDSPSATGDHTNQSPWSLNIRTIDLLLQARVKPLRIGGLDLAKEGTATSTTPLVMAFDERASGDYTAAAPSFDASNVLDRNTKTLWIAERFMGTPITYNFGNADNENIQTRKFNQVYINPPPGTPAGAKWIEIIMTNNSASFQRLAINSADPASTDDTNIWILGSGDPHINDLIILCQNEKVFRQLNPLAEPNMILEASSASFFNHIVGSGGQLWLRTGVTNDWYANMVWGDGNGFINHPDAPGGHHYTPSITAPTAGQTMRYLHSATASGPAAYWQTSMIKSAGYKISMDVNQWIAIELPGLGLMLTEAITASVPASGSLLKISDSAGPSNSGLPSSGTLSIGDEQISYSAKVEGGVTVSGRGVNSTTAAIHDAGDTIYMVESGILSDAHLLNSVGWRRYGGTIYPARFKLYKSILQTPRHPEEEGWGDDWSLVYSQSPDNTASTWDYALSPSLRCRHLMFTIDKMTTDPARVRLNEVVAVLDNSAYDTSLWLANGVRAGAVISQLITNAGLSAANILTDVGNTNQLYDQTTADDSAWAVISDLAEFAGCRLVVGRDSRINVADDQFWDASTSIASTWAASNASDVQATLRNGIGNSQVKVKWRTPDSSSSGVEAYPANEQFGGSVIETAELIYANSTVAQISAQKRYDLSRYPFEFTVNTAVSVPFMRPGEVHTVTWQYNRSTLAVVRKALLKTIEHKLRGGQWLESLHLIQIEREAEY